MAGKKKIYAVVVAAAVAAIILGVIFFGPQVSAFGADAKIKKTFGEQCTLVNSCKDMDFIDCGQAYDGPAYYVKHDTLEKISTCGGACMHGCTDCPPKEWDCK